MKKLTWFDRITAAITFAEANELDTAKTILTDSQSKSAAKQTCKECEIHNTDLQGAEARS